MAGLAAVVLSLLFWQWLAFSMQWSAGQASHHAAAHD